MDSQRFRRLVGVNQKASLYRESEKPIPFLGSGSRTTGAWLAKSLGADLTVGSHVGEEFKAGQQAWDAMGTPGAYAHWNPEAFFNAIDKHLLKSETNTVIDLTGASGSQARMVRDYVKTLDPSDRGRIHFVEDLNFIRRGLFKD